jgi:MbtH protein
MNASLPNDQTQGAFVSGNFIVLINHEEQYGIWPVDKPIPPKWRPVGVGGSREDCLAYVRRVWTDMRPLSVRQRAQEKQPGDVSE